MTTSPKFLLLFISVFFLRSFFVAQEQTSQDGDGGPKKIETKFTEVVTTDSLPATELLKRAVSWIKEDQTKYKKSSGVTTSNKAECLASFPIKPKELNPVVDYTGKIIMKVVIECKDNKFRYIVSDIKHVSKNGRTSAGSIDNKVPECGSMTMDDLAWKKLRGEAIRNANQVVSDLKAGMAASPSEGDKDEW